MSKMSFASSVLGVADPFSFVDSPAASTLSIHYSIDSELADVHCGGHRREDIAEDRAGQRRQGPSIPGVLRN